MSIRWDNQFYIPEVQLEDLYKSIYIYIDLYLEVQKSKGYRISTIPFSLGVKFAKMSPQGWRVCDLCIPKWDVCQENLITIDSGVFQNE